MPLFLSIQPAPAEQGRIRNLVRIALADIKIPNTREESLALALKTIG